MNVERVLLFASKGAESERVAAFCRATFPLVAVYHGDWNQRFPEDIRFWEGDLVVSYCSRWIIPELILRSATLAAINFHPGPPEYPGVGGLNWALYENAPTFGVTCHHMDARADSGAIIEAQRFPLLPTDDVENVFHRTHLALEAQAYTILSRIRLGKSLPTSQEVWCGKNRSRRELNELSEIALGMSSDEISRRARATTFLHWKPILRVGDHEFELKARRPDPNQFAGTAQRFCQR